VTPETLAKFPLTAALGSAALEFVAPLVEERAYRAGEVVFHRGDPPDGIYLVERGGVRVMAYGEGEPIQLALLQPGEALGEMAILGGNRDRGADAVAGPDGVSLAFFSRDAIRELRHRYPAEFITAVLSLSRQVVERLDHSNDKLVTRLLDERREGMQRDLVVHDLRSPLASIESAIQAVLLREDIYGPVSPRQRTALLRVSKNVGFLRLLTDSILEIERARLAETRIRKTTLEEVLASCAAPLLALLQPEKWLSHGDDALSALSGTRLSIEAGPALKQPLRCEPVRLAQVVMNLVGNALRYTEGPVELRARERNDRIALEVLDHGPGVPAEMRERIFQPFQQRELLERRLPVGKGFGLAGVREMVTSMGGSIAVLDRGDGTQGARFCVELPTE
jgi:signal transduction histidine kinase